MSEQTQWFEQIQHALRAGDADRLSELLRDRPTEELVALVTQFDQHGGQLLLSVSTEHAADVLEEVEPERAREVLDTLPPESAADVFDELEDDHASDLVQAMGPERAAELLDDLPPEDVADVLEMMPTETARNVLAEMPAEIAADVLEEMVDEQASDILESMGTGNAADLLEEIDPHEAADLLQEMERDSAEATLAEMEVPHRDGVIELLSYPEDSAGGQMTKRYFALREHLTVARALRSLRNWAEHQGSVYYIYVVDGERRLIGVVPLHRLVIAEPDEPIREIMTVDPVAVAVGADQEEVAQLFRKYRYVALPVVDDADRLVGIITIDDAVEVIDEEATEDAHHMVGLGEGERVFSPVLQSAGRRIPWLYVNLGTALVAASVVSAFQDSIHKLTMLAVLMPMVAGVGGCAGNQALTIIVRGLALGEVDRRGAWRALSKQIRVGLLVGTSVGLGFGLLGWVWLGTPLLGLIAGLALMLNLMTACFMGAAVPLLLRLLGIDPALAASIFVTAVTDSAGFFFFLGLATLFLRHLT